jgi:hypothetical protein
MPGKSAQRTHAFVLIITLPQTAAPGQLLFSANATLLQNFCICRESRLAACLHSNEGNCDDQNPLRFSRPSVKKSLASTSI